MLNKQRNYGIDLLRMISMFMIVIWHILGHGGVSDAVIQSLSFNYATVNILIVVTCCAVNCYALISGYVGIDSEFKYSRIVSLWLQVFFYSACITIVFLLFFPDTTGFKDIFKILPITFSTYWYFTAYFCMFFFIPCLNYIVNTMPQRQLKITIFTIFLLFSILPTLRGTDLFRTFKGYSVLWITLLYIIGAYIKKYGIPFANRAIWGYITCVIITWLSGMMKKIISLNFNGKDGVLGILFRGILHVNLVTYVSPTILLAAIFLLCYFAKMKIKSHRNQVIIKFLAPLTFGVYLIHDNPLIRKHFMSERFAVYTEFNPVFFILSVLGTAICIYLVCSLMEWLRIQLFKVLHVQKLCKYLEEFIKKYIGKLINIQ